MLAIGILKHAFLQIFGNLRQLLHIVLLPLVLQVAGALLLMLSPATHTLVDSAPPSLFVLALAAAFILFPMTWAAVNWHRYILLNQPQPMLPSLPLAAMLRYFGTSLLVSLLVIVLAIFVLTMTRIVLVGSGTRSAILAMGVTSIAVLFVAVILFRLSTALPAAAVGASKPIRTAWKATSGHGSTFLLVVLMMAALQIPLSLIEMLPMGSLDSIFSIILDLMVSLVGSWVYMIIVLSVLTTLYGHFVENRPLRTSL